mgnify:CR=1 FL=1
MSKDPSTLLILITSLLILDRDDLRRYGSTSASDAALLDVLEKVGETITLSSTALTGATNSTTTGPISLDAFSIDFGSGGTCTLTSNGSGVITTLTILSSGTGYTDGTVITITAAAINTLLGSPFGTSVAGGAGQAVVASADVEGGYVVPDGLGFRFKTTGYPSSPIGGAFDSQSLFIKKSTNSGTDADMGIVLYYTQSIPTPAPAISIQSIGSIITGRW